MITAFRAATEGGAEKGLAGGEGAANSSGNLEFRLREIGLSEGEAIRVLRRAGGMVYLELGPSSFALRQSEFERLVLAPLPRVGGVDED